MSDDRRAELETVMDRLQAEGADLDNPRLAAAWDEHQALGAELVLGANSPAFATVVSYEPGPYDMGLTEAPELTWDEYRAELEAESS